MTILEKIENKIEELKKADYSEYEYTYRANAFDLSLSPKDYIEVKDIDINRTLKNVILLALKDLKFTEFKHVCEVLNEKDFTYLYDLYVENHVATLMEVIEFVDDKTIGTYMTVRGKRAYERYGLIWNDNEARKSEKERKKILIKEESKQKKVKIKELFSEDFLKDVYDIDKETLTELKKDIYEMLENKYDSYLYNEKQEEFFRNVPSKTFNKRYLLRTCNKISAIFEKIQQMNQIRNGFLEKAKELKKDINTKVETLQKMKTYIQDEEHLVENIEKINFNMLIDDKEYVDIFKIILNKQQERFKSLKERQEEIESLENTTKIEQILKEHNIIYKNLKNSVKEKFISCQDITELDKKLSLLQVSEEDCANENFVTILVNSSSKKINSYAYFIHINIVKKETLLQHLEIFDEMEENFKSIAKILTKQNISFRNKNYDEAILFFDYPKIAENEKLLSCYNRKLDNNNFNYIFDAYNYDILDYFIENSIKLDTLDTISLTHDKVDNFIKRCQICLSIGIDIYTKSGNLNRSFLLGNGFYCNEEELEDYLLFSEQEDGQIKQLLLQNTRNHINEEIRTIEAFRTLETYKREDGLAYEIEGTFISRPKVMRNLTYFYENDMINENTILQSIIYNSNLNDEQIDKIKSVYQEKKKIKKQG